MHAKSIARTGAGRSVPGSQSPLQRVTSPAAIYVIDPGISRFTARAFATGLLSAFGHSPTIAINEFDGQVRLAPDSLAGAGVRMRIQAGSLAIQDQISDKDRKEMERAMREDVLEISRFPEIRYECDSVAGQYEAAGQSSVILNGDLTLCGTTRNVPVHARFAILGNVLRASGEFDIRQSDFGIRPVSAVGGALRLKDELKFSFDIAARKQNNPVENLKS